MLGSEGCKLKRGRDNRKKKRLVILGGVHYSGNCRSGVAVWLQPENRLWVATCFVSLVLVLARALPESELMALVCANSTQLGTLVRSLHLPCN